VRLQSKYLIMAGAHPAMIFLFILEAESALHSMRQFVVPTAAIDLICGAARQATE
jgi:hypothetical protein